MATDQPQNHQLLSDEPVIEFDRADDLKFDHTAGVLARAALHTRSPITIGVYGTWGTGKTSLMRLMHDIVDREGRGENAAVPVWFNAWQYEREENLIIPLIATIARDIKKRETQLQEEEQEQNKISLDDEVDEAARKAAKAAHATVKKALGIMKVGGKKVHDALRSVLYGLTMKGEFGVPGLSKMEISASMKDMIERYEAITQDTLMARSLYFDAFDKLRELAQGKDEGQKTKKPQIVVFIDDLDRCFPEKAVHLLESVKLVLHLPNFAFVLGVYPQIIEGFIRNKYAKEYPIEAIKAASAGDETDDFRQRMNEYLQYFDEYLDKIVQIHRRMPERKPDQMVDYIRKLVKEGKVFPEEQAELAIPLIAEAGRRNPRAIVRLLNRIIVSSRISALESPDSAIDSLALLIHEATNEARYAPFIRVLDLSVIFKDEDEDAVLTIGELIARQLKTYEDNHVAWISGLRETKEKLKSSEDFLETAIKTLAESLYLCNLLKSETGLRWLKDKSFRESLEAAADIVPEDKTTVTSEKPLDAIGDLESKMVKIEGTGEGTFKMGDGQDNDNPVHEVKLDDFEISSSPVTQAQYEAVIGEGKNASHFKGADLPVESVSWHDAQEFCEKLTEMSRTGRNYLLPTEAQWEYACRAGDEGAFCFGDDAKKLGDYAWYNKNSEGRTHPVRQKKPNKHGLYDMHGNVWEWCYDWYGKDYYTTEDAKNNPDGPNKGSFRVLRGGSWDYVPQRCRSAIRDNRSPDDRNGGLGFRVLAVPAAGKLAEVRGKA